MTIAVWGAIYIRLVDHHGLSRKKNARGLTAVGIFLLFGMTMAALAGTTLLWRGSPLDRIWVLNPRAYAQLAPLGWPVGAMFVSLAFALGAAARGWFMRRRWGWQLTVAVIATQVLGDLVNLLRGDFVRGAVGFVIASALLTYLLRADVKREFPPEASRL